jgi:hypothetical protein
MDRLSHLFEPFLRERTYVNNVTASTREWYGAAWKAFRAAQASAPERPSSAPLIAKSDLQQFVVHLRERGLKVRSGSCHDPDKNRIERTGSQVEGDEPRVSTNSPNGEV